MPPQWRQCRFYWDKGKPHLDEIILKLAADPQSMILQLEAGAGDAICNPRYLTSSAS
jgi:hypothetical protein